MTRREKKLEETQREREREIKKQSGLVLFQGKIKSLVSFLIFLHH